jgi:hypothetical protein
MQWIALKQDQNICFYASKGGHVFLHSGKLKVSQPLRWAEGLPLRHDCIMEGEQFLTLEHDGWTWLDAASPCVLRYAAQAAPVHYSLGERLRLAWHAVLGLPVASKVQP